MPRYLCALFAALLATGLDAASVTDFGAAGDGVTDDTQAFRQGVEYAGENSESLLIPPGRYLVAGGISIDYAIEFIGSGHQVSIVTAAGGAARFFVRKSGTSFRDLAFEDMIEPVALVSREDYVLEDLLFERCRFERIGTTSSNRGAIGLSSGNSSQQIHQLKNLKVRESTFREIDAHAINVRGTISRADILSNRFLHVVNTRTSAFPVAELGGYAIRLGTDDGGALNDFVNQGNHLIEGNVIRNLKKKTSAGNLMGILTYGSNNIIRHNLIEDIDGTPEGNDTNAIYIRGGYNHIIFNTIRDIRGADDDGAVTFKGASEVNFGNTVAFNRIENIYGMSAVEASTFALQFYGNVVVNAPTRGFMQRAGQGLSIVDNTFRSADTDLRTQAGIVYVFGNRYINSRVWLSQRRTHPSDRQAVYIHENLFRSTAGAAIPMILFANGVQERFVSVHRNRFENTSFIPGEGNLVNLASNGTLQKVEIVENDVVQNGAETVVFRIGSPDETVADNAIVFGPFPNDPPVLPANLKLKWDGSAIIMAWAALENQVYEVQYSTDLKTWSDYGEIIPGYGVVVHMTGLPNPWGRGAFYRLVVSRNLD